MAIPRAPFQIGNRLKGDSSRFAAIQKPDGPHKREELCPVCEGEATTRERPKRLEIGGSCTMLASSQNENFCLPTL